VRIGRFVSTPLVIDIDGTLTRPDGSVPPEIMKKLYNWSGPIVIATGNVLPLAIALCRFTGIEEHAIAENGGISYIDGDMKIHGDRDAARAVIEEYREQGFEVGWGNSDIENRWRETEIAVSRDSPLLPLNNIANQHGLDVVDTGYAYHVKPPNISKGNALSAVVDKLGHRTEEFVAVGDSENDVSLFRQSGMSIAVANADPVAKQAADRVTEHSYGDGAVEALSQVE
jgi:phosphoglycolate phosphatase (TIGR01487 family)